jgi:DNA transposition AAA+ family ATPase
MNAVQKEQIKDALGNYLEHHGMSQNEFAKQSGVNVSYISNIRAGNTEVGSTPIADKWYMMIAERIGFSIEKNYWETRPTDQMLRIASTLDDARKYGYTNVIIGETGCGKSYMCKLFQKQYVQDVFIIKLGKSDNVGDVLDKTIEALNILDNKHPKVKGSGQTRSKSLRIRKIIKYLHKLKMEGLNPTVIWDEAEYMNLATLCSIKEFYDDLRSVAALILIGTDQLLENLRSLSDSNKPGMPQFYSRIKFGIRELKPIDRKFSLFLEDISDKEIKDFLTKECNNYRELHDVLVPSMREADRLDTPLTVNLIRNVLGMSISY